MSSGQGTATSSGALIVKSANAGAAGGSGAMSFSSGTSKEATVVMSALDLEQPQPARVGMWR